MGKRLLAVLLAVGCLTGCRQEQGEPVYVPFAAFVPVEYKYVENAGTGLFFEDEAAEELVCISPEGEEVYRLPWPDEVRVFHGFARCQYEETFLYMDCEGNELPAEEYAITEYSYPRSYDRNLVQDQASGLWGYTDQNLKWILRPEYSYATPFDGPLAYVRHPEKGPGFVDKDGNFRKFWLHRPDISLKEPSDYDNLFPPHSEEGISGFHFSDGRLLVGHSGFNHDTGYTYLTETGDRLAFQVEPASCGCPYQDAREFSDGLAAVKTQGKWGYINTSGEIVITPQFIEAHPFLNQQAIVRRTTGEYCFIDMEGNVTTEIDYIPEGFSPTGLQYADQIVVQNVNRDTNVVDKTGEFLFREHQRYFFLDCEAKEEVPVWCFGRELFEDGVYLPVCRKADKGDMIQRFGEFYILDYFYLLDATEGEILVGPAYFYHGFEPGVVTVRADYDKFGYLNEKGEWIIEPILNYAGEFRDGIAYAQYGNEAGIIRLEDFG